MPSFDALLVRGVATYSLELFRAVPDLHTLYVPIGLGSGICGAIAARDALGLRTQIVGRRLRRCAGLRAFDRVGRPVSHDVTTRIADGMACRTPDAEALEIIRAGVERIVEVERRRGRSGDARHLRRHPQRRRGGRRARALRRCSRSGTECMAGRSASS